MDVRGEGVNDRFVEEAERVIILEGRAGCGVVAGAAGGRVGVVGGRGVQLWGGGGEGGERRVSEGGGKHKVADTVRTRVHTKEGDALTWSNACKMSVCATLLPSPLAPLAALALGSSTLNDPSALISELVSQSAVCWYRCSFVTLVDMHSSVTVPLTERFKHHGVSSFASYGCSAGLEGRRDDVGLAACSAARAFIVFRLSKISALILMPPGTSTSTPTIGGVATAHSVPLNDCTSVLAARAMASTGMLECLMVALARGCFVASWSSSAYGAGMISVGSETDRKGMGKTLKSRTWPEKASERRKWGLAPPRKTGLTRTRDRWIWTYWGGGLARVEARMRHAQRH